MKIFGLVGSGGTGKSHHAQNVAREIGADLIIDDGLLIANGRILSGFSAKFETNQISAVKRAIFNDVEHRKQIIQKISEQKPNILLVLGTSKRMVETICQHLNLDQDILWIPIEDVSTSELIELAKYCRKLGMHAIPMVESKLDEPRLRQFIRKLKYKFQPSRISNTSPIRADVTVVTPAFRGGFIYIHPSVIRDSIEQFILSYRHPFDFRKVRYDEQEHLIIHIHVRVHWIQNIPNAAELLLREIRDYLHQNLGFPSTCLFLHIDSIKEH